MNELKDTNPKDAVGSDKLPLHLFPVTAQAAGSLALLEGMLKYGRANWREAGVKASVYVAAADRHMKKWFEGQDLDPDSGMSHLWKALACIVILIDAQAAGKLVDDRNYRGDGAVEFMEEATKHVKELKARYGHLTPKHYTAQDMASTGCSADAPPVRIDFDSRKAYRCICSQHGEERYVYIDPFDNNLHDVITADKHVCSKAGGDNALKASLPNTGRLCRCNKLIYEEGGVVFNLLDHELHTCGRE